MVRMITVADGYNGATVKLSTLILDEVGHAVKLGIGRCSPRPINPLDKQVDAGVVIINPLDRQEGAMRKVKIYFKRLGWALRGKSYYYGLEFKKCCGGELECCVVENAVFDRCVIRASEETT